MELPEKRLPGPFILRNHIKLDEDSTSRAVELPYVFIRGAHPGPKGVILATIHGDELNGIGIIHELVRRIVPALFTGELYLLPVVSVPAYNLQSRYLPDRRDLNRLFPGAENGSEGSRLANLIWKNFVENTDFGIDLHSASYSRWNYPHIRGNMRSPRSRLLARSFGHSLIIHSQGVVGSLRKEATKRGIPFILFEAGQVNRIEEDVLNAGVEGLLNVLHNMEMIPQIPDGFNSGEIPEFYYSETDWVRAEAGGLFYPRAHPGDKIERGEELGIITDLLGKELSTVQSPVSGHILGFNQHPQVVPGRALYHIAHTPKPLR